MMMHFKTRLLIGSSLVLSSHGWKCFPSVGTPRAHVCGRCQVCLVRGPAPADQGEQSMCESQSSGCEQVPQRPGLSPPVHWLIGIWFISQYQFNQPEVPEKGCYPRNGSTGLTRVPITIHHCRKRASAPPSLQLWVSHKKN